MELDDLKQSWNKQSENELKNLNNNFMEMIQNKSYGPLAELKSKVKQQLIAFPILIAVFIYLFIKRPELFTELFSMLFYFGFCIFILAGFYWSNYKLINRMQQTDSTVKETIEKNLRTLENNFKKHSFLGKVYFLITIVLVEVFMYLHLLKDFETWYAYSFLIRIVAYIGLFVVLFLARKYFYQKNFGKHITYLKELLEKIK